MMGATTSSSPTNNNNNNDNDNNNPMDTTLTPSKPPAAPAPPSPAAYDDGDEGDNSGGVTPMDLSRDMEDDDDPSSSSSSTRPSPMNVSSPTHLAAFSKTARQLSSPHAPSSGPTAAVKDKMSSTLPNRMVSAPSAVPDSLKPSPTKPNYRIRRRDATMTKVLLLTTVDPPPDGILHVPYFSSSSSSSSSFSSSSSSQPESSDGSGSNDLSAIPSDSLSALLATRLSLPASSLPPPHEKEALTYLHSVHARASVSLRNNTGPKSDFVTTEMLRECMQLCVSYAVSSLTVPELFPTR